jgi:pimeloyl-ACP methyl ester carboxylesterase
MRMNAEIDIDDLLPQIGVPTLVLHRSGEHWVSVEQSRHLAKQIPGARLVEPGPPALIGEVEPVHRALEEFMRAL